MPASTWPPNRPVSHWPPNSQTRRPGRLPPPCCAPSATPATRHARTAACSRWMTAASSAYRATLPRCWPVCCCACRWSPPCSWPRSSARTRRTAWCRCGCSSSLAPSCSSRWACASTVAPGMRSSSAPATWNCWWPSAPRPRGVCRCGCGGAMGCRPMPATPLRMARRMCISKAPPSSSRWCSWASGWKCVPGARLRRPLPHCRRCVRTWRTGCRPLTESRTFPSPNCWWATA